MRAIDLNCDLGEGEHESSVRADAALLAMVSSVNIACGGHAGDEATMRATAREAMVRGVAIGAHPGYADRPRFGRVSMAITPGAIEHTVAAQVGALDGIVRSLGGALRHVKPHGAIYHDAMAYPEVASAVARGVERVRRDLTLVGLAGAPGISVWRMMGHRVAEEAFADRRYEADGTLRPRAQAGAVITHPAAATAQALSIALLGRVRTASGAEHDVRADTICIHGDTPGAARIARAVVAALRGAGVAIRAPSRAHGSVD